MIFVEKTWEENRLFLILRKKKGKKKDSHKLFTTHRKKHKKKDVNILQSLIKASRTLINLATKRFFLFHCFLTGSPFTFITANHPVRTHIFILSNSQETSWPLPNAKKGKTAKKAKNDGHNIEIKGQIFGWPFLLFSSSLN